MRCVTRTLSPRAIGDGFFQQPTQHPVTRPGFSPLGRRQCARLLRRRKRFITSAMHSASAFTLTPCTGRFRVVHRHQAMAPWKGPLWVRGEYSLKDRPSSVRLEAELCLPLRVLARSASPRPCSGLNKRRFAPMSTGTIKLAPVSLPGRFRPCRTAEEVMPIQNERGRCGVLTGPRGLPSRSERCASFSSP